MIKFTIITCTYNAAKVVGRTLDSLRRQTYPHVEHLILDGKSSDSTLQLARAYQAESEEAETDHEIVIVSEPDSGLYDAMNKGIGMATGDYLLFLNAGDVLPSEDTLELVADSVGDGEQLPGVLYGYTDIVDSAGRFLRHLPDGRVDRSDLQFFDGGISVTGPVSDPDQTIIHAAPHLFQRQRIDRIHRHFVIAGQDDGVPEQFPMLITPLNK